MVRLAEIADIRSGASIRGKLPVDPKGNALAIQQGDITADGISLNLQRISYAKADRHQLRNGDVLLRSKGSPMIAAEFRQSRTDDLPTVAAASVLVLQLKSSLVKPCFLSWFINTEWMQSVISTIKTGTHIPVIPVNQLRDVEIPIPPIEEQEHICSLSDLGRRYEALAQNYHKKIEAFLVLRSMNRHGLTD